MKIYYFILYPLLLLILSCGPSKEEIAIRQKFIADSLQMVKHQQEFQRIHQEKIEVGKAINRTNLTKILDDLKNELATADAGLRRINEFQFGRTIYEKDRQLNNQNEVIKELEVFIENVEKEISMTHLYNSFDFQFTPEGTVEHIFYSAQNKDFTKMRHLLDPYGEYEKDAQFICWAEMLPDRHREEWISMFQNGRIMGEAEVKDNIAKLEIAIGSESDRLVNIYLTKRSDKWYIAGM